jgi:N-methylhydantoinase B
MKQLESVPGQVTADPVTTEVIRNFMSSCAEDMNAALFRSAYTPVIYEGRDCAVALLDAEGEPLGMSTGVPIFLGNLEVCVKLTIDRFGRDWFGPGDIVAMNDPYLQGTHLHDVTVFGPIFHEGKLVGFAATRAHWQDVGGRDPGTTMGSIEVFQEGFRMGPTRVVKGYEALPDWMDFLRRASRFGYELMGDFSAQIAAIRTGERRFDAMLSRVGLDVFEAAKANIFRQAEELDRAAIRELPDGTYHAEGYLDDDGQGTGPIPVVVTVNIEGDRMVVDLAGTSPAVRGAINCGYSQTVSAVRLSYKALINTDLPVTGGTFATLEVRVPDDCIFNAKEPAACEWYFTGLGLLCDLIVTALEPAIGDRVVAPHYGDSMVININGIDPARRRPLWVVIEPTAGGWGASPGGDGESALINLTNGSFKNIPVEVYETKFPVRIERFSIRQDSGGAGRYRGGCGVVREYRLLSDASVSVWFERSTTPAWGLAGGGPARAPVIVAEGPAGSWSGLKANCLAFPAGTLVRVETGGGGSYGPAFERPPAEVARDVRERYVSIGAAKDQYGVVLDPVTLEVDEKATATVRAESSRESTATASDVNSSSAAATLSL